MLETVASLDLGSTWIKAAVYTADGRRLSLARVRAPDLDLRDGRFDAGDYLEGTLGVLREAVAEAARAGACPGGIVCASQRATIVVVDDAGKPMTPAVSWQAPMVDPGPVFDHLGAPAFTALTGLPAWPMFPLFRLAAGEEPLRSAVDRGGLPLSLGDFVLTRLGASPATEPSLAAATGLLDGRLRVWDEGLVRLAGLGSLPALARPGSVVGALAAAPAAAVGLPPGLPLFMGGSDQAYALMGAGIPGPGEALVNLGTAATVLAPLPGWPRSFEGAIVLPHVLEGQWVAEGFVGAFGAALDALSRTLGLGSAAGLVEAAAARSPEERAPLFLVDRWRLSPTEPARALTRESGRPEPDAAGIAALVIEALGFELALALEGVERVVKIDRLRVAGGATRSRPLVASIVDALGRPVVDPGEPEAALRGAALLAFSGPGGQSLAPAGAPGAAQEISPRSRTWRDARLLRYRELKEMSP